MPGFNNRFDSLFSNRFCLKLRRNQNLQRATRKLEKAPNGFWSFVPLLWGLTAWVLSIASSSVCTFVTRRVRIHKDFNVEAVISSGEEEEEEENVKTNEDHYMLLDDQGIGFWGWESDDTCYSYKIGGRRPKFDAPYQVANSFLTITDLVGGLAMVCLFLGVCYPIEPFWYKIMGIVLLLMGILDLCTLSILASDLCDAGFFSYSTPNADPSDWSEFESSTCRMGIGSRLAVSAAVFWLISALCVLLTPLTDSGRTPHLFASRGHPSAFLDDDDDEALMRPISRDDPQREAKLLHQARLRETRDRYRDMFKDDDDESLFGNRNKNKRNRNRPDDPDAVNANASASANNGDVAPFRPKLSKVSEGNEDAESNALLDGTSLRRLSLSSSRGNVSEHAEIYEDEYDDENDEDELDNLARRGKIRRVGDNQNGSSSTLVADPPPSASKKTAPPPTSASASSLGAAPKRPTDVYDELDIEADANFDDDYDENDQMPAANGGGERGGDGNDEEDGVFRRRTSRTDRDRDDRGDDDDDYDDDDRFEDEHGASSSSQLQMQQQGERRRQQNHQPDGEYHHHSRGEASMQSWDASMGGHSMNTASVAADNYHDDDDDDDDENDEERRHIKTRELV